MQIEIKLNDSQFCDGCPLDRKHSEICSIDFIRADGNAEIVDNKCIQHKTTRPQECVDKYGE